MKNIFSNKNSANHSNYSQAFTLIELLVVISIIGLLSSIILASLSNARSNAILAGAKQFSSSLDTDIGSNAVGWWTFSECSGTTLLDKSGYSNTGTLGGSPLPTWLTDTPFSQGCSLSFNGAQYVDAGNNSSLTFSGSFTLSAWIKFTTTSGYHFIISKSQGGANGYELFINSDGNQSVRFSACDSTGTCTAPYFDITALNKSVNDGKWHNVVGVYSQAKTVATIYIDGTVAVISYNNPSTNTLPSTSDLFIGGRGSGGGIPFTGSITQVRVFASDLTADAVQKLYAEEKPTVLMLADR